MMEWSLGKEDRCREVLLRHVDGGATGECEGSEMELTERLLGPGSLSNSRTLSTDTSQGQKGMWLLKSPLTEQFYTLDTFPVSYPTLVLACLFAYREGIHAVGELCQSQVQATPPGSHVRACAHQLHSKIIRCHVMRHPSRAAVYRDQLDSALSDFPASTLFHTLYIGHETKAGLRSRIYSHIMSRTHRTGSLVEILWSIWAMCGASQNIFDKDSGGNARVRAVLAKAVASDRYVIGHLMARADLNRGKHSAVVWKLAIEFEEASRCYPAAKQLVYRAIATLGSVKGKSQGSLRSCKTDGESRVVPHGIPPEAAGFFFRTRTRADR